MNNFEEALYKQEHTPEMLKAQYRQISASTEADNLEMRQYSNYKPVTVSTGFEDLDTVLSGGLRAGLYVVGADTGLGKTSLVLQIANNIANSGYPVYYVSLEMAREELVAKQISRATYQHSLKTYGRPDHAKTHLKILNTQDYKSYTPEDRDVISKAYRDVEIHSTNLFIEEGIADITVEDIKRNAQEIRDFLTADKEEMITKNSDTYRAKLDNITDEEERKIVLAEYQKVADKLNSISNTPVIIVDYLQILQPTEEYRRNTEKQIMDFNIVELKRISRDLQTPVIAISSFNRDSYGEPVTLKCFKESGAIEYTSDVVIGLQYSGVDYEEGETSNSAKRKARIRKLVDHNNEQARNGAGQLIDVKILKNRHGHKGKLPLMFTPMFNHFNEISEEMAEAINVQLTGQVKSVRI